MFTLAISCLTTSNLPWLRDLTFQVPMQYYALQHQTLLSPSETSTMGHCFPFGSASSFLLELFLCSSAVAYWALPTWGVHLSVSYLFMRQEGWSGLPFPSVDHILSELSTMTRLSWVALHVMAHGFIDLDEAVTHVISLVSFLWLVFTLSTLEGWGLQAHGNFLIRGIGCGENWVLP